MPIGLKRLHTGLHSPDNANSPTMTSDISSQHLFRLTSQNHTPPSPWAYDSAFGIVHRHGCRICRSYKTHLAGVDESDIDYAHAVHDREAELRDHYLDGLRRGRETQRQHDNNLLKTYRSQRDSACESRSLYKLRLEEAEAEVTLLRDELLALRVAYEELRPQTPPEDFDWTYDGAPYEASSGPGLDRFDSNLATSGTSESSDESEEDYRALVLARLKSDDIEVIQDWKDGPSGWTSHPTEALDHSSSEDLVETDEVSHSLSPQFTIEDERSIENLLSHLLQPEPRPPPRHPRIPRVSLHQSEYDTPEGIRRKMELAWHPGNEDTLAEVKALVSIAHMTSTGRRTEVQKILLSEWRKPPLFPSPCRTRTLIHSSDVYVDASQLGIGFVFEDQWQAWELKKGWKERTREIQWAEAVAVELGVRLMIKAGYRHSTLRLRSDNSGVVEAISKVDIYQSQVGETVEHIYRLCQKYDITLEIEWIPGEDNPADHPSRLRPEQGSSRFPYEINIPSYLREFVFPYVRTDSSPAICSRWL